MKKQITTLFAALTGLFVFAQNSDLNPFVTAEIPQYPVVANPGSYVENQVLLMLQPNAVTGEIEEAFAKKGFVVTDFVNTSKSLRVWTFTFASGVNVKEALAAAKTFPQVQLAQLNHYTARRVTVPNDANFSSMWGLDNTGQNGGTPDADVDAPEAWDITTGGLTVQGDTIVVAVIDGGFSLAHQDLNFWKNYSDIPGNGIDDDGNGYIDDRNGWNAYNSNGNITSDNHGTHVSGTVGARGNNTVGVAGVNWGVKIMPVMGSDGTESVVIEAYTYVLDARRLYNQSNGTMGAFVVSTNASFGVDAGQPQDYPIWCAIYDSLGAQGILNAGATANQNWDVDAVGDIPTACTSDFMIAVTNTTRYDLKNSGAAFGLTTIDLGAPGTSINSTLPGNSYGNLTGTSMATPHVAGAIALMYAAACSQMITDYRTHPDSIANLMRGYLLGSVDQISALNGLCTSNGRLNLYGALTAVQTYQCTTLVAPGNLQIEPFTTLYPNPANSTFNFNYYTASASSATITVTNLLGQPILTRTAATAEGINTQVIDVSGIAAGVYFVQLNINGQKISVERLVVE